MFKTDKKIRIILLFPGEQPINLQTALSVKGMKLSNVVVDVDVDVDVFT